MTTVSVGCLQLAYPSDETRADRINRVVREVAEAAAFDLIVLPELWDVGFFAFDDFQEAASPLENGPLHSLRELARARACVIVAGSVLERDGRSLHNTVTVLGPGGDPLGAYRKKHLFGHNSREAELLTPGEDVVVVPTSLGAIGLATCFDLRFPDQFARMRSAGADLLAVPAAWPAAREEHWKVLARARAIDTQTPLIACNGVGPCYGVDLAGGSLIVDARGAVLASGGSSTGWVSAKLDLGDTRAWRSEFRLE